MCIYKKKFFLNAGIQRPSKIKMCKPLKDFPVEASDLPTNVVNASSISASGRIPWSGKCNSLQYPGPKNSVETLLSII